MRLATFRHGRTQRLGAISGDWVIDLNRAHRVILQLAGREEFGHAFGKPIPPRIVDFLQTGNMGLENARQVVDFVSGEHGKAIHPVLLKAHALFPAVHTILFSPVPNPGKIICIGANYPPGQVDAKRPDYPIIFMKPASGLIGPEEAIYYPPVTADVAYEAELVIVIGTRGKYVSEADACNYVVGYTQANDVGARDIEKRTSQWTSGKLMDTFCPVGPALVTRDEIGDPGNLPIVTRLNGQVVQRGNTKDMYFQVPTLVSYVSQLTTLEPGDLILTGSPKTIDGQPAPVLSLHPGDRVEIQVGNLGSLCNRVIEEPVDGWQR